MARDCFADEVAIDFPHVGRAVARMRAAFLGERGAAEDSGGLEADLDAEVVMAELRLSPREARLGGLMPIDVAMRGTCGPCGGRGETWAEPCGECRGSGTFFVRHAVRVFVPPGLTDGARFRFRVSSPDAASVRVEVRVAVCRSVA
jgi:hypothetical protein